MFRNDFNAQKYRFLSVRIFSDVHLWRTFLHTIYYMSVKSKILRLVLLLVAFASNFAQIEGQTKSLTLLTRQEKRGLYVEKFQVMAADTSVRHGEYSLIYKGDVIEHGYYERGGRVGAWDFYNLQKMIELRYDYDKHQPVHVIPHGFQVYSEINRPSIFLGSPMVPYHFIMQNTFYPLVESENEKDCKVVLALEINALGQMTGYHLAESSRESFNEAVLCAAAKIPTSWRWVPAKKDGRNVPSEYKMILIFEAVD